MVNSPLLPGYPFVADLMPQIDGHYESIDVSIIVKPIPVQLGFRPKRPFQRHIRNPVRLTIKRNRKENKILSLPVISNYNCRSLVLKMESFCLDMKERLITLSCLSELWEVEGDKDFDMKIEDILYMKGLKA